MSAADMPRLDARWPVPPAAVLRRLVTLAAAVRRVAMSVAVALRDMVAASPAATPLDRSTMDRSTTAALATTPTVMARAMATATIMDAPATVFPLSAA